METDRGTDCIKIDKKKRGRHRPGQKETDRGPKKQTEIDRNENRANVAECQ
jgi:hypothetical protein